MGARERVGMNVKRLRRERDLSQEELAHLADLHQTYLSAVENANATPPSASSNAWRWRWRSTYRRCSPVYVAPPRSLNRSPIEVATARQDDRLVGGMEGNPNST